jgi:hypothetical protein
MEPDIVNAIQSRGFYCHYNPQRSRYLCASRREGGIPTGISFALRNPTNPWLLTLWSGLNYSIPAHEHVASIAIDVLSGLGTSEPGTPTKLSDEFVAKRGLTRCSEFYLCAANDFAHIDDAEAKSPIITFDAGGFADRVGTFVDECVVANNVVAISLRSVTCEIGFKSDKTTRRVIPIVFLREFMHSECEVAVLRVFAQNVPCTIYSDEGRRLVL